MNILFAQIIGMAGVILMVGSMQFKKKKHIMLFQLIANILYGTQYLLLSAFSASLMNLVGITRCYIIYKYEKNNKTPSILYPIILCIITIIIGSLSSKNFLTLLPVLISLSHTITAFFKNPKIYKITFLCTCIAWLFYNYSVMAFTTVAGNIFEIISTSISLYKNTQ